MSKRVYYKIEDDLSSTPCPYNRSIDDRPIMVGSILCNSCKSNIANDVENCFILCKGLHKHKKMEKLLNAFEKAAIANSWKGGGHPSAIPIIEKEYKRAKEELLEYLKSW